MTVRGQNARLPLIGVVEVIGDQGAGGVVRGRRRSHGHQVHRVSDDRARGDVVFEGHRERASSGREGAGKLLEPQRIYALKVVRWELVPALVVKPGVGKAVGAVEDLTSWRLFWVGGIGDPGHVERRTTARRPVR